MTLNARTYQPPGPVGEAFLRDRSPVRFIKGPIGSGKTNLCIFDGLTVATEMPVCVDGIRRFKGFLFRDTYTKLWDTLIPSWWQWFDQSKGQWTGARGRQATHVLRFDQPDGCILEASFEFRALDETVSIEDALKGLEGNWAYMNEADTQSQEVLTNIIGRLQQKRYPPQRLLPPAAFSVNDQGQREPKYFVGVVGDLNPPDVDSWVYELFEEKKPPGHKIFHQPSGRSPMGENRAGVSLASYERLAELNAHRPDYVRRMIDGMYGYSRDGMPVYPEFDDMRHVAETDIKPLKGLPLRLGFDQGVTGPAMVATQFTYAGQLLILDELVPNSRIGPTAFGKQCRNLLRERYGGFDVLSATCDLAGFSGGDKEEGDHAWAETVSEALGVALLPAPTNELQARHDVIRQLLTYFIDGRVPALWLSPRCRFLRKGFNSHYKIEMVGTGKNAVPAPKPKKNAWSNPHDALQYIGLDIFGVAGVTAGAPGGHGRKRIASLSQGDDDDDAPAARGGSDFNVFSV